MPSIIDVAPCPVCGVLFPISGNAVLDAISPPRARLPMAIVPGGLIHLLRHLPDGLTDAQAAEWAKGQLMAIARQQGVADA